MVDTNVSTYLKTEKTTSTYVVVSEAADADGIYFFITSFT